VCCQLWHASQLDQPSSLVISLASHSGGGGTSGRRAGTGQLLAGVTRRVTTRFGVGRSSDSLPRAACSFSLVSCHSDLATGLHHTAAPRAFNRPSGRRALPPSRVELRPCKTAPKGRPHNKKQPLAGPNRGACKGSSCCNDCYCDLPTDRHPPCPLARGVLASTTTGPAIWPDGRK